MNSFMNYEVSPPLAYIVGICMFINALLISAQGYMRINPKYGYQQGSKLNSIAMFIVATWLLLRFLTLLQVKTININVIFLSLAFLFWRLVDMRDYIKRSKKSYEVQKRMDEASTLPLPTHEFGVA